MTFKTTNVLQEFNFFNEAPDLCWCLSLFLRLHFLFLLELFQLFSLLCFFFQLCFCLWWTCKKKRTKLSLIVHLNLAVHKILHKYL